MAIVTFKHTSGLTKEVKQGFSWTTLFFGFIPALTRGDLKWAIIMLILAIITGGISLIIFPFVYNGIYINGLIERGWKVVPKQTQWKSLY